MDRPVYHLEGVVHERSKLLDFDGPLDLILTLLSRNRMEIQDIQISLLLEQYLQWMDRQKRLNLDVASEFVAMASHLLFIKTRMLLSLDQNEGMSEMEELMAALEQRRRSEDYQRIKAVVPELDRRFAIGSASLTRGPLPLEPERRYRYQHEPEDLIRALRSLLERSAQEPVPPERAFRGIVGREPYPVERKAAALLVRLRLGSVALDDLFRESESRSELVATFLAVLELCRMCRAELEDDGLHLRARAPGENEPSGEAEPSEASAE